MLGLSIMVYYGFGLAFVTYLNKTNTPGVMEWWFLALCGALWPMVAPLTIVADLIVANER